MTPTRLRPPAILGAAHLLNDNLRANHPHAVEALDLYLSTLPIAFTPMAALEAVGKTFAPWAEYVPDGWTLFQHRLALRKENAADMTREVARD